MQENVNGSYLLGSVQFENSICSVLILCVSLLGLAANGLSSLLLLRLSSFRNSFGLLASCHALSNCGVLVFFLIWSAPIAYFGLPYSLSYLNHYIGQAALFFQTSSFHSTLLIACNRFWAITLPSSYRFYFTYRNTLFIIGVINIVSFLYYCVYFFGDCDFYFDAESLAWTFGQNDCSQWLSNYIDFYWSVSMFSLAAIIDCFTFIQLRMANIKLSHIHRSQVNQTGDNARRQRKEVIFFVQSFVNTLTYCLMLIVFHVIAPLEAISSNRFSSFLATTLIWCIAHAGGGFILIAFNTEIRKRLAHPSNLLKSETSQGKPTITVTLPPSPHSPVPSTRPVPLTTIS